MDEKKIALEASHEAVERAKLAAEALEVARMAQLNFNDSKMRDVLADVLRDVFGEKENSGRFIDTSRIPLICQDIKGIHGTLDDIKDSMKWITRLIIGAVVLALLGLILIKK